MRTQTQKQVAVLHTFLEPSKWRKVKEEYKSLLDKLLQLQQGHSLHLSSKLYREAGLIRGDMDDKIKQIVALEILHPDYEGYFATWKRDAGLFDLIK